MGATCRPQQKVLFEIMLKQEGILSATKHRIRRAPVEARKEVLPTAIAKPGDESSRQAALSDYQIRIW